MVGFYGRVLGMAVTKRVTIGGAWMDAVAGLSGIEAEVVYLEAAQGARVELIRYLRPMGGRPEGQEQANTLGLRHLAFRVSDIDAAVRLLQEAGVEPQSAVAQVPDTQVTYAGSVRKRLVYFHDPERNLLELCEYR